MLLSAVSYVNFIIIYHEAVVGSKRDTALSGAAHDTTHVRWLVIRTNRSLTRRISGLHDGSLF